MARILRGVKGMFGLVAGGGGCFSFFPFPRASRPACPLWGLSPCGIFGPSRGGFLKGCNFWPFLAVFSRFEGISLAWCGFGWVGLLSRLVGLVLVVILFACVRCPPAKGKKPFCLLFPCLCPSLCPSFLPWSFHPVTDKKKRPFLLGRFLCGCCGVWFLPVSGCINRNGTRQAVRGFFQISVFPLWRCRFLSFGPWGLQYSINCFYRWPPSVSYTKKR